MKEVDVKLKLAQVRKNLLMTILKFKINILKNNPTLKKEDLIEGPNYWTLLYEDRQFVDINLLESYFSIIQYQTAKNDCEFNDEFFNYDFETFLKDFKKFGDENSNIVKVINITDTYIELENPFFNGYDFVDNSIKENPDMLNKLIEVFNNTYTVSDKNVMFLLDSDIKSFCKNKNNEIKLWSITSFGIIPKKCLEAFKDIRKIDFSKPNKLKLKDISG